MSEPEVDPHDTHITIEIEWSQDGDVWDFGLRYPNDEVEVTSAQQLLDHIKAESRGSKSKFIEDWSLLDDPRIMISVRRKDDDGKEQRTYAEWDEGT